MDYPDLVLASVVVVYSLALSVFVALGTTTRTAISFGSVAASVIILHALFVNPPT